MEEHGELLSHEFILRRYGVLEQVLLNIVRQLAPVLTTA